MAIDLNHVCSELLNALEAFDAKTIGLGLYSSEDLTSLGYSAIHQEWHKCLKTRLEKLQLRVSFDPAVEGLLRIITADRNVISLKALRISKIKVRKFGSSYRLDPHLEYPKRWKDLKFGTHLRNLWSPSYEKQSKILLFIGFDAKREPFCDELGKLMEKYAFEKQGVTYLTRFWEDIYERNFSIRLCSWSRAEL